MMWLYIKDEKDKKVNKNILITANLFIFTVICLSFLRELKNCKTDIHKDNQREILPIIGAI